MNLNTLASMVRVGAANKILRFSAHKNTALPVRVDWHGWGHQGQSHVKTGSNVHIKTRREYG